MCVLKNVPHIFKNVYCALQKKFIVYLKDFIYKNIFKNEKGTHEKTYKA